MRIKKRALLVLLLWKTVQERVTRAPLRCTHSTAANQLLLALGEVCNQCVAKTTVELRKSLFYNLWETVHGAT